MINSLTRMMLNQVDEDPGKPLNKSWNHSKSFVVQQPRSSKFTFSGREVRSANNCADARRLVAPHGPTHTEKLGRKTKHVFMFCVLLQVASPLCVVLFSGFCIVALTGKRKTAQGFRAELGEQFPPNESSRDQHLTDFVQQFRLINGKTTCRSRFFDPHIVQIQVFRHGDRS